MIDTCFMTGAGSGIGRATALALARQRRRLVLIGRQPSLEQARVAVLAAGGQADCLFCDLENLSEVTALVRQFVRQTDAKHFGVVLAAAILGPQESTTGIDLAAFESTYRINVLGNLAVLQACLPKMLDNHHGRVVCFGGGGAAYAYPIFPAYALTKVSTVRLVENLAVEYPPATGLSFVCLAPGAVETPMLAAIMGAGGEVRTKVDMTEPVTFVCSYLESDSLALTGRFVHVRDDWQKHLAADTPPAGNTWMLRRQE